MDQADGAAAPPEQWVYVTLGTDGSAKLEGFLEDVGTEDEVLIFLAFFRFMYLKLRSMGAKQDSLRHDLWEIEIKHKAMLRRPLQNGDGGVSSANLP